MIVRFLLVVEGNSDAALVPHLQVVCVDCGASEAIGIAPDFSRLPRPPARDIRSKLKAALALEPSVNLIFIHRDADARTEDRRRIEIEGAAEDWKTRTAMKHLTCRDPPQWNG